MENQELNQKLRKKLLEINKKLAMLVLPKDNRTVEYHRIWYQRMCLHKTKVGIWRRLGI